MKNLVDAYESKGIEVIVGYNNFISGKVVPDVIHFHMPHGILSEIKYNETLFFEKMDFFKKKGVKFLYTAHNILPHKEVSIVNYPVLFCKMFNYIDMFIHHGKSSIEILKKEFPNISNKHHIVCHHGDYLNDMRNFHESQECARKILKLPLNKKIILIFGQLQHKNTSFAENVFAKVRKNHKNAILLMAGVSPIFKYNRLNQLYYRVNNRYLNKCRKDKILIHKRFSQYETYLFFISSNVIFLPHNSGLTSGIIPMAATLGKPFAYPDIGVFEEQANECFAEKYEKNNIIAAYTAIDKVLTSGIQTFENSKWLLNNNWEKHVENIVANI